MEKMLNLIQSTIKRKFYVRYLQNKFYFFILITFIEWNFIKWKHHVMLRKIPLHSLKKWRLIQYWIDTFSTYFWKIPWCIHYYVFRLFKKSLFKIQFPTITGFWKVVQKQWKSILREILQKVLMPWKILCRHVVQKQWFDWMIKHKMVTFWILKNRRLYYSRNVKTTSVIAENEIKR